MKTLPLFLSLLFFFVAMPPAQADVITPSVSVGSLPESTDLNRPFVIPLTLEWQGSAEDLTVKSLNLGNPAFLTGSLRHQIRAKGDRVVYALWVDVTPIEVGLREIGPMILTYQDATAQRYELPIPGQFTIRVGKKPPLPALFIVVVLGLMVLGIYKFILRRRQQSPGEAIQEVETPSRQAILAECRKILSDGEPLVELYGHLRELKALLPAQSDPLPPRSELDAAEDRARYSGLAPDIRQLERWIRAVEVADKSLESSRHDSGVA